MYTHHKPVAACRLSVHWSRIAYCFHSHKYYDYEYCVVVNRSIFHQLCAQGPRESDRNFMSEVHSIVNLTKKIFSRLKDTTFDITTCVNSPRHACELPDWPAHETAAVEVRN